MDRNDMLVPENVPIPNPNILGRVVDNEAVLVLPDIGKVKVFNEVGAAIWQLIDGKRDIRQISAEICAQFDVDAETAKADTLQFIADLIEREIVTIE